MSASEQGAVLGRALDPAREHLPDAALAARLDSVPVLRDRIGLEQLTGGITNRNFKVTTPTGVYVARVSSPESSLLAIDRDAEHLNSRAAAESGAGAPVEAYAPEVGVLVVRFLPGRTFTDDDVREPRNLPRIATACRLLHSGPRFVNEFDMFDVQRGYLAIVQDRGFRLPDGYLSYADRVADIERALAVHPQPTMPCNNDLLAGNIIDDGRRLWLIDYEYSGNNDPCFELGNIWSEAALPLRPAGRPRRRLLRPPVGAPRRPIAALGPAQQVRLDALGIDPGRQQHHRLRLLVLGDGEVRTGGGRVRGPRPRAARGGGHVPLRLTVRRPPTRPNRRVGPARPVRACHGKQSAVDTPSIKGPQGVGRSR